MSNDWIRADWSAPVGIIAGTTLRDSQFELPAEPQWLNQVHGTRVVHWGSSDFDAGPPDADAIISDQSGSLCVVRTADCLPVLLSATDGSEIAAVHAGWRGLAAGIRDATLEGMKTPAQDLVAWLGPAISQPAFEVGLEVRERFSAWGETDKWFQPNERGRLQADLVGLARARLHEIGVSKVFGDVLCTYADPERFYSYRRDGTTGRLLSFVFMPM